MLLHCFLAATALAPHRRHEHHVTRVLRDLPASHHHLKLNLPNASWYNEALANHFDTYIAQGTPRRWSQRYYVDARFWCGSGCPVFLYIGGEGPQGPVSDHLFMWTLAEKHGALMFALEHRFYGESRPTADMSDKSLELLTSTQALADLARFVGYVNSFVPGHPDAASTPPLLLAHATADSAWVTFGGSYPGDLATWFKLKYPALAVGTVGSSAPVFAQYDFYEYGQVVGAALANPAIGGSHACAAAVRAGAGALVAVTRAADGAPRTAPPDAPLPRALRPCSPITSALDLATYYASVFGGFQEAVQYNLQGRPPYVSDLCRAALDAGGAAAPLASLAAAVALFDDDAEPAAAAAAADGTAAAAVFTPQEYAAAAMGAAGQAAARLRASLHATTASVEEAAAAAAYSSRGGGSAAAGAAAAARRRRPKAPACVPSSWRRDMMAPLVDERFSPAGCDLNCTSDRQWVYQSCNEFGYFQTATGAGQPFEAFGGTLNISTAGQAVCEQAFGLKAYSGPRANGASGLAANTEYGGRRVLGANITMPNGNMDPWHALSVVNRSDSFYDAGGGAPGALQRTSEGVHPVELHGTAHCRDMFSPDAFAELKPPRGPIADTPAVQWAHAAISAAVARYVS
eukprot:Transcript_15999.p1 GENE.Transcript_15999~~Transcript_15999.p1  ORF type:complete len:631 (+),score=215.45 Transcript_15999:895-2787(+)